MAAERLAFAILIDMTLVLGFLPLRYVVAALHLLRRRAPGRDAGITLVPGHARGRASTRRTVSG